MSSELSAVALGALLAIAKMIYALVYCICLAIFMPFFYGYYYILK